MPISRQTKPQFKAMLDKIKATEERAGHSLACPALNGGTCIGCTPLPDSVRIPRGHSHRTFRMAIYDKWLASREPHPHDAKLREGIAEFRALLEERSLHKKR